MLLHAPPHNIMAKVIEKCGECYLPGHDTEYRHFRGMYHFYLQGERVG
jgi:hypothetical protein